MRVQKEKEGGIIPDFAELFSIRNMKGRLKTVWAVCFGHLL